MSIKVLRNTDVRQELEMYIGKRFDGEQIPAAAVGLTLGILIGIGCLVGGIYLLAQEIHYEDKTVDYFTSTGKHVHYVEHGHPVSSTDQAMFDGACTMVSPVGWAVAPHLFGWLAFGLVYQINSYKTRRLQEEIRLKFSYDNTIITTATLDEVTKLSDPKALESLAESLFESIPTMEGDASCITKMSGHEKEQILKFLSYFAEKLGQVTFFEIWNKKHKPMSAFKVDQNLFDRLKMDPFQRFVYSIEVSFSERIHMAVKMIENGIKSGRKSNMEEVALTTREITSSNPGVTSVKEIVPYTHMLKEESYPVDSTHVPLTDSKKDRAFAIFRQFIDEAEREEFEILLEIILDKKCVSDMHKQPHLTLINKYFAPLLDVLGFLLTEAEKLTFGKHFANAFKG